MNAQQLDAIALHARRCRAAWEHRFAHVGALDSWEALVRDRADLVEIEVTDTEQVARLVGATMVVDGVSVAMMQDPGIIWTPQARDVASLPLQLTAALVAPWLEVGR